MSDEKPDEQTPTRPPMLADPLPANRPKAIIKSSEVMEFAHAEGVCFILAGDIYQVVGKKDDYTVIVMRDGSQVLTPETAQSAGFRWAAALNGQMFEPGSCPTLQLPAAGGARR